MDTYTTPSGRTYTRSALCRATAHRLMNIALNELYGRLQRDPLGFLQADVTEALSEDDRAAVLAHIDSRMYEHRCEHAQLDADMHPSHRLRAANR